MAPQGSHLPHRHLLSSMPVRVSVRGDGDARSRLALHEGPQGGPAVEARREREQRRGCAAHLVERCEHIERLARVLIRAAVGRACVKVADHRGDTCGREDDGLPAVTAVLRAAVARVARPWHEH